MMHKLEILDKILFFRGLTDDEKEAVGTMQLRIFRYHPGTVIIRKGDRDACLYFILKGTATVVGIRSTPLAILKVGEVFGEVSFLAEGRARTANVVANGEVIVMRVDQHAFDALNAPLRDKLKEKLIHILIDRLVTTNEEESISFNWTHEGPASAQ